MQAIDLMKDCHNPLDFLEICHNPYEETLYLQNVFLREFSLCDVLRQMPLFLENRPPIKTLDLDSIEINVECAKLISNMTIHTIRLMRCNIGDVEATILSNTACSVLVLGCNKIGDAGAAALAMNEHFTQLFLRDNLISCKGAQMFALNTTLSVLCLGNNNIGDTGTKALATNTTLSKLMLLGNNISEEGKSAFKETNPITRCNNAIKVGVKQTAPSLLRLCLFNVKNNPDLLNKSDILPNELKTALNNHLFFKLADKSITLKSEEYQEVALRGGMVFLS